DNHTAFNQLVRARLVDERGGHRGQEGLALADADEQRALQPRADELARVVVVDDHEREVALELLVGGAHGLGQVAVVVPFDQVDDHLGVGLGLERVPFGLERALQLAEVLDDPVQDDRELAVVAARQRVRILLRDRAVGRPARVPEAGRRDGAVRAGGGDQVLQVADRAHVVEGIVLTQREAGRVVAAIRQPLKPAQEEILARSSSDVSDDAAHDRANTPLERETPDWSPRPGVGTGQPSSRVTRAEIVPQASFAAASVSASARMRMTGSVPDGLTSTRPLPSNRAFMRSTSFRTLSGSWRRATRTFAVACGKRGITAAASSSVRPPRAPQSSRPAASPSPVTWPWR